MAQKNSGVVMSVEGISHLPVQKPGDFPFPGCNLVLVLVVALHVNLWCVGDWSLIFIIVTHGCLCWVGSAHTTPLLAQQKNVPKRTKMEKYSRPIWPNISNIFCRKLGRDFPVVWRWGTREHVITPSLLLPFSPPFLLSSVHFILTQNKKSSCFSPFFVYFSLL